MTTSYPVQILGTQYLVIIDGKSHIVGKDKKCHTCGDKGETCPAVYAVARYLREGGARAPDALPTPPRRKPEPPLSACPICGAAVERDAVMDNARRGLGWRCRAGGYVHLYLHRYDHLKAWYCGEGAKRHAMFIPDEPEAIAVQLCLPEMEGSNIIPFVHPHQHSKRAA